MISKNIFPEIVKNDKRKKQIKESGCCFTSCGGTPFNQGYKENSDNKIKKALNKII
jgi:hypothetical protein